MSVLLLRKLIHDIFELPTDTEDSLSVSGSIYETTVQEAVFDLPMKERRIISGLYSLDGNAETVASLVKKMSRSRASILTLQKSAIIRLSKMALMHPIAEALEMQGAKSVIIQRVCTDASDARLLKVVETGVCPATDLLACSVRLLHLSSRAENLLVENGILSIRDLVGRTTENISDLPKVGEAILEEIEANLKAIGLALKS